jgi:nucleotide-binding universal stress UspA family protein
MRTIVVGVDGSEGARQAVRVAVEEARLRGARLEIVSAWELQPALVGESTVRMVELRRDGERDAERASREAVDEARSLAADLEVEGLTVEGPPGRVLVDRGADAELIVVGTRGLGGVKSLVLGSVSGEVVRHAPCPVLVVRALAEPGGTRSAAP